MKPQNTSTTTPVGLVVLFIIYVILIGLILVFSQQILSTIQNINPVENTFVLIIIIILPLILIGAIIINIVKLIQERAMKNPGARLKTRLVVFFVIVALLSLIPQAVISIRFVDLSINFWANVKIVDVLEGGLKVALRYHADKNENLKTFSRSPVLVSILRGTDFRATPQGVLESIREADPEINQLEIFDSLGNVIAREGIEDVTLATDFALVRDNAGLLPKKEIGNQSILSAVVPFTGDGGKYYLVLGIVLTKEFNEYASRITSSMSTFRQLDRYKDAFRLVVIIFYLVFSFPIFLLSILISFLLTDEIIRPIVHLEEATRRVADGDFSFRILSRSNDELSVLVDSFNKMVSELAFSRRKIMQTEKITTWQEIAQRLAHEVTNPLTPIRLQAERILKKYSEDHADFERILNQGISSIITEVDSLSSMLRQFKEFAKPPELSLRTVNLRGLIEDAASMYSGSSHKIRIELSKVDGLVNLNVDAGQLKQVFLNLFTNAIQAIPESGTIHVSTSIIRKGNTPFVRITVRDSGEGIDDDVRDRIFDPYFTTKKDGTGLGLSIVEKIIFDHDGNIWFESKKGAGTTFYIDLPIGGNNG